MEIDEGEINIGADESLIIYSDDETTASSNANQQHHEAAAIDYHIHEQTTPHLVDSEGGDRRRDGTANDLPNSAPSFMSNRSETTPILVTTANGQRTSYGYHSMMADSDSFPIPRVFISEEKLKAKQKLEKKKAKKAAGWKKGDDMEGHVGLTVTEILDLVGEKDNNASQTQSAQQVKKKLRKKLSTPKQKSSCGTVSNGSMSAVNGKYLANGTSSGSGDSEGEGAVASSPNQPQDNTNKNDSIHASGKCVPSASVIMVDARNHYTVIDNEHEVYTLDGEFKEVHRKKKTSYHRLSNGHMDKNKPVSAIASNSRPTDLIAPHKSHRANGHIKRTAVDAKSSYVAQAQSKPSGAVTVSPSQQVDVDLSLNSFPLLDSQNFDRGFGLEVTDYRNTDPLKDKDSCIPSWAKIAAKPTSLKPVSNEKSNNISKTSPAADLSDVSSTAANVAELSSVAESNSLAADVDVMTTSAVSIEFGTVTSSSDLKTDQQVQDILSQSFTEGQNIFKCNQPRKLNRHQTAVDSHVKHSAIKIGKSKGVEFLDKFTSQQSGDKSLASISFGFEEPVDGVTDNPISLTPVSDSQNPPVGVKEEKSITLSQGTSSPDSNQSVASSIDGRVNTTTLPQPRNILPFLLAPSSKTYTKKPPTKKVVTFSDNAGGFDIISTVRMLNEGWEEVMLSQKNYGSRYVKCLQDLE